MNWGAVPESLESGSHTWKQAVSAAETREGGGLWMLAFKVRVLEGQVMWSFTEEGEA